MDPVTAVLQSGGIARFAELRDVVTRAELAQAVGAELLVRVGRGRYALPIADEHYQAAVRLSGVLAGLSAAMFWGWKVKTPPERPQVLVPRGRNVAAARKVGVDQRWGQVTAQDRERGVLGQVATVLDCARTLPFDAALAVADSALRDGVPLTSLLLACEQLPRTGRSRAMRVVELADRRAANPFESVLRAVLLDVPGASFVPQVWIKSFGRADLVDRDRRLVIEGDSFEYHSTRVSLLRDMERYNAFQIEGYDVLRFGWEHVMFQQGYVRETVIGMLATQERSVGGTSASTERKGPRARRTDRSCDASSRRSRGSNRDAT